MRIIEPSQFSYNKPKPNKRPLRVVIICLLIVLVVVPSVYSVWIMTLPLPPVTATSVKTSRGSDEPVKIAWPEYGQAAVGSTDMGVLATKNTDKSVPIASISKVITALAVLQKRPLVRDETGPNIVITPVDTDLFQEYLAKNGVVIPVKLGETLTQYQLLQATLLVSANNAADMLARWAFGSVEEYVLRANLMVAELGMARTTIADASGFSPKNKSTAADLVLLASAALKHPVIADIVVQKQVTLPVAGTMRNTNIMLGKEGNIGLKTGTTDEAGGCFLFASKQTVAGKNDVVLVGAILGAQYTIDAMEDSLPLVRSAAKGFEAANPVEQGQTGAVYTMPWQQDVAASASQGITFLNWKGTTADITVHTESPAIPSPSGAQTGSLRVVAPGTDMSVPLVLAEPINAPSLWWRMKRQWPFTAIYN